MKDKPTSKAGERTRDKFNRGEVDFTKQCTFIESDGMQRQCLKCEGHPGKHTFKLTQEEEAEERAESMLTRFYELLEKIENISPLAAEKLIKKLEAVFVGAAITGEDDGDRFWTLNETDASEGLRVFVCAYFSIDHISQSELEDRAK